MAFLILLYGVSAVPEGFQWGVNGHPYVQEGYCQVPVTEQLNLVKDLGATWYRCDWDQARLESKPEPFDALVDEAAKRGIRILPVIFPSISCRSDATPAEIREASFDFARALAAHYRGRITHYELDNERDCFAMIQKGEKDRNGRLWEWGDPDGNAPEQYEDSRYEKVKAELLGLHEGIKTGAPEAKTIVDTAGWLHYGFIERLVKEDNVPFDILGWHWYSEMGDITRVRGEFNLLEHLRGYGKPIWITEVNRRGGSLGSPLDAQADYLVKTAKQFMTSPGVEAFFVYELLDEPYFGPDNAESHYGLVEIEKGPDSQWRLQRKKPAFDTLHTLIQGEPAVTRSSQ